MTFTIKEGEFKMLRPALSMKGYWIVGAMVGDTVKGCTYTSRVWKKSDVMDAIKRLKDRIFKEQPGIKEVFE